MDQPKVSTAIILNAAFAFLSFATSLLDFKSQFWGTAFCVFTAILLVYAAVQMARLPYSWGRRLQAFRQLRFCGRIPLSTAAKLAYEEARANKTLWAEAAERLAVLRSPAGILDYVATYFGAEVPIWGSRPPSDQLEEIPAKSAKNGSMEGGATRLTVRDNANTEYINLQVRAKDVRKVIEIMGAKVFADGSK
ncbi:hypothetical protein AB4Z46_18795 [Variovorax sp. M-6]|uniref:hypothetical protein n=1 Tax=Variovorax sp. M-6 TaxID=3233041 RepID=UPI003F99BE75